jgi:zinc transporter 1/2/3
MPNGPEGLHQPSIDDPRLYDGSTTLADNDTLADSTSTNDEAALHGESNTSQITALLILEFGVIFHSVFIGLTLAVAGQEFVTLYVVLTLHQTFEGLAIGSRLATIHWQGRHRLTPYYMAVGYALSTPIAIAIGLAVRTSIHPHSKTSLIINGVFDSVSAGILIYTGLVELMANDFVLNKTMQTAPRGQVWSAVLFMTLGAALMAILGIWA